MSGFVFSVPVWNHSSECGPERYLGHADTASWYRERMRKAHGIAKVHGLWSQRMAKAFLAFDAHIVRNTSGRCWYANLSKLRSRVELMQRRMERAPSNSSSNTLSAYGGRTGTGGGPGQPPLRRHDALVEASSAITEHQKRGWLASNFKPSQGTVSSQLLQKCVFTDEGD